MKIEDVVPSVFPTTRELRQALGVTKAAISQWRKSGIPLLRQYQIREIRARNEQTSEAA